MNDVPVHVQSALTTPDVRAWGVSAIADLGRRGLITARVQRDGSVTTGVIPVDAHTDLTPVETWFYGCLLRPTVGGTPSRYVVPDREIVADARAAGLLRHHPAIDPVRRGAWAIFLVTPTLISTITLFALLVVVPTGGRRVDLTVTVALVTAALWWATYLLGSVTRGLTPSGRLLRGDLRQRQRDRLRQLRQGSDEEVAALVTATLPEMLAVGPLKAVCVALERRPDCRFPDLTWASFADGQPLTGPALASALRALIARTNTPDVVAAEYSDV